MEKNTSFKESPSTSRSDNEEEEEIEVESEDDGEDSGTVDSERIIIRK